MPVVFSSPMSADTEWPGEPKCPSLKPKNPPPQLSEESRARPVCGSGTGHPEGDRFVMITMHGESEPFVGATFVNTPRGATQSSLPAWSPEPAHDHRSCKQTHWETP
jgi:hypothetical protein